MGIFITMLLTVGIAYLVVVNVKKGIQDAKQGTCSGCSKECESGRCDDSSS